MGKSVIIIGGGIIGLCSAYYLRKEGHHVTVVDQSAMVDGASYVNAGYLSPSHIIPLTAPGVMKKGLKWMFNPKSPLYIKPSLNPDFLKWVLAFNRSCNSKHVEKSIPAIKRITLLSQELYDAIKADEFFSFHLEKKGMLMLCQTEKILEEEIKTAKIAQSEGLDAYEISQAELRKLEPHTNINTLGAVLYECDSHSTPQEFMNEMKSWLRNHDVSILQNEKVIDLAVNNQTIKSVVTEKQELKADEFVLAAGSWSHILSKKLDINLLLQAGKGYRINTFEKTNITRPAILTEAKVAVTPMNGFTRFAGTMEIAGINNKINPVRVDAIAEAVNKYYPDIRFNDEEKREAASGLRPVSADGLPYIGKSSKCNNLTIATGHAMMGWSMGPATGKLVSEIISEKTRSMNLELFNPDRKF
ncbi:amino acid dehydrogenase [Hanstruepera neustonica]|uniref:Amino acid dehydrogenase n=1 Tax=Hanstruepera neustonica TaxID=1445657 RepID=A0A2K1E4E5_9FLAO|nr:FAD-dependent oxidoreductase [Hanstruepera neustonica]PNQ75133.1 amino acid dehydrogenase [Hanstruepera neustonica]